MEEKLAEDVSFENLAKRFSKLRNDTISTRVQLKIGINSLWNWVYPPKDGKRDSLIGPNDL